MKALLSFLLACLGVSAATPSFNSFEPTQFSTNGLRVSLQEPLVVTNLYSSNIFVTNITANTIYTTNIYATNLYVTNIYNDITFNGRVTFNTNVTFVTNVTGAAWGTAGWLTQGHNYWTNLQFQLLGSGVHDLLECPSGYRIFPSKLIVGTTNMSGLGNSVYVKTNGNYYVIEPQFNIVTNASVIMVNGNSGSGFILEPGEMLSISNSAAGANVVLSALVFTNSIPAKTYRAVGITAGTFTLYEVPTNKIAKPFGLTAPDSTGGTSPNPIWRNRTGSTLTLQYFIVPVGDSPSDSNRFSYRTLPDNSQLGFTSAFLTEGTKIVFNTNSSAAGQTCWITIYEDNE